MRRRSPPKQLKDPPPEKYSIEWYLERAKETERSKAAPDATRARPACARAARRLRHSLAALGCSLHCGGVPQSTRAHRAHRKPVRCRARRSCKGE